MSNNSTLWRRWKAVGNTTRWWNISETRIESEANVLKAYLCQRYRGIGVTLHRTCFKSSSSSLTPSCCSTSSRSSSSSWVCDVLCAPFAASGDLKQELQLLFSLSVLIIVVAIVTIIHQCLTLYNFLDIEEGKSVCFYDLPPNCSWTYENPKNPNWKSKMNEWRGWSPGEL